MYCLETKAEFLKENPGLKKVEVKKKMKELFNKLDDKQKAAYIDRSNNARKEFLQKIEEFMYDSYTN